MRLRFTIRDLLWLTALAAVLLGWTLDHIRTEQVRRDNRTIKFNNEMLQDRNIELEKKVKAYQARLEPPANN